MLDRNQGICLLLWVGDQNVAPMPYALTTAFVSGEVTLDAGAQGFQLSFLLRRDATDDYGIFSDQLLKPLARIQIGVRIGGGAAVSMLFDGVLGHYQVTPGQSSGVATLTITGRDFSQRMDLVERKRSFHNRADSAIVEEILKDYRSYLLSSQITETRAPQSRDALTRNQLGTDLAYLRELAERNGFVFYIEPTGVGRAIAYFGPDTLQTDELPPLNLHVGPGSNVRSLNFSFDPLARTQTQGKGINYAEHRSLDVPPEVDPRQQLSAVPAPALRTVLQRDTAKRSTADSHRAAEAAARNQPDVVTAEGEVDTLIYGALLRPRHLILVRGAGNTYDGLYAIRRVSHHFERGQHTQRFSLGREGTGVRPQPAKKE